MENCSRTGLYFRQISMKLLEHSLYQSLSPLTITKPGQVLKAIDTGMAVLIPNFLAGMDAAVTMLLLSEGSFETTEGTKRISGLPSCISLTADQDKKAELTSI